MTVIFAWLSITRRFNYLRTKKRLLCKLHLNLVSVRMSKKILFVDDDEHWRSVVAIALTGVGHEVLGAADATQAMTLMEGVNLGLIILDLNLAGESGLALMRYLRYNQPGVPVILYTGMEHDDAAVVSMLQQGAHQYVRKGAMEDLVKAVRRSFR